MFNILRTPTRKIALYVLKSENRLVLFCLPRARFALARPPSRRGRLRERYISFSVFFSFPSRNTRKAVRPQELRLIEFMSTICMHGKRRKICSDRNGAAAGAA